MQKTKLYLSTEYLISVMGKDNLTIKDVHDITTKSMEMCRLWVRGEKIMGPETIKMMSEHTSLDRDIMNDLVLKDKLLSEFGIQSVSELLGQRPEMTELAAEWDDLKPVQRDGILKLAKEWALENRRTGGKNAA